MPHWMAWLTTVQTGQKLSNDLDDVGKYCTFRLETDLRPSSSLYFSQSSIPTPPGWMLPFQEDQLKTRNWWYIARVIAIRSSTVLQVEGKELSWFFVYDVILHIEPRPEKKTQPFIDRASDLQDGTPDLNQSIENIRADPDNLSSSPLKVTMDLFTHSFSFLEHSLWCWHPVFYPPAKDDPIGPAYHSHIRWPQRHLASGQLQPLPWHRYMVEILHRPPRCNGRHDKVRTR